MIYLYIRQLSEVGFERAHRAIVRLKLRPTRAYTRFESDEEETEAERRITLSRNNG